MSGGSLDPPRILFADSQKPYRDLLTVPRTRVVVHIEQRPTILGNDGVEELGARMVGHLLGVARDAIESVAERLAQRDWRTLRLRLVNLNLDDPLAVCDWLASAGYVPKTILSPEFGIPEDLVAKMQKIGLAPSSPFFTHKDVLRIANAENLGWEAARLTSEILQFLRKHRDVIAWLMGLENKDFQKAVALAHELARNEIEYAEACAKIRETGKSPKLKDPREVFLKELDAPSGLDAHTLALALRGSGVSESLSARLQVDDEGKPAVIVFPNYPVEVLYLSLHVDKNFSQRRLVECARCGRLLDQIRGRDRFCSDKCANYVTTMERRAKIRFLIAAQESWEALSRQQKKAQNRWEWIAASARRKSKGKFKIEPSWAKQELTKLKRQKTEKKTSRQAVEAED